MISWTSKEIHVFVVNYVTENLYNNSIHDMCFTDWIMSHVVNILQI